MFLSFIVCALLPVIVLAVLTVFQVGSYLDRQNDQRLHSVSKALGLRLFERLQHLDLELRSVVLELDTRLSSRDLSSAVNQSLGQHFSAVNLASREYGTVSLLGPTSKPPRLTAAQRRHLRQNKPVLYSQGPEEDLLLLRSLSAGEQATPPLLYARVKQAYLWKPITGEMLPPETEICIADDQGKILHTSFRRPPSFSESRLQSFLSESSGSFNLQRGETTFESHFWSLFLKYHFFSEKWVVLLHKPKDYLLAPFREYTLILALVSGLALLVVVLLSSRKIREQLVPLEELNKATKRVTAGDFTTEVTLRRDDEFAELAHSFNRMARTLGRQFQTMSLTDEIVRGVLSSLKTESIISIVMAKIPVLIPCQDLGLLLFAGQKSGCGLLYSQRSLHQADPFEVELTSSERELLSACRDWQLLEPSQIDQNQLPTLRLNSHGRLGLLPLSYQERLFGALILVADRSSPFSEEDLQQARHVVDQIAVALSNARLLEELDSFTWGTLYALARAIDIKSPWTAGHSERVTKMALNIGRHMGLTQDELESMHRGGLLHDIGKLGVPSAILDKPDKLTDEEYRQVCEHTRMGARILEPLPAFSRAVTIVRHHHEQFDGKGYPDGLAGDSIDLACRIFAVADNYDALISERPYRPALDQETVVAYIQREAGRKFDPDVVEAFLEVIADQSDEREVDLFDPTRSEYA